MVSGGCILHIILNSKNIKNDMLEIYFYSNVDIVLHISHMCYLLNISLFRYGRECCIIAIVTTC